MSDVRWTSIDNYIAETELRLSEILTRELTARPGINLRLLFLVEDVRKQVRPILDEVDARIGKRMYADAREQREGEVRKVIVEIRDTSRFGAS